MSKPTEQELKEFANALQLSISTKVGGVAGRDNEVEIMFDSKPKRDDKGLFGLLKLFDGEWKNGQKSFVVLCADKINWPKITLFLLLTRMNEENIRKLGEIDSSMEDLAEQLGLKPSGANIGSVEECSRCIFEKMGKKKMTIRELSEATGLTQVSISNFKAGNDIRLSNLIKITKALGMNLKMRG